MLIMRCICAEIMHLVMYQSIAKDQLVMVLAMYEMYQLLAWSAAHHAHYAIHLCCDHASSDVSVYLKAKAQLMIVPAMYEMSQLPAWSAAHHVSSDYFER